MVSSFRLFNKKILSGQMEQYFTNLDFPEKAGVPFPLLNHHHLGGFLVVWGRELIWPDFSELRFSRSFLGARVNPCKVGPYDRYKWSCGAPINGLIIG